MATNTEKILILGNGFDLDLGRQTLYKDFYESEFCPKDYPAPIIKHLNEKWTDNLESVKWYSQVNLASSFILNYQVFLYSYIHIFFHSTYHKIKKK